MSKKLLLGITVVLLVTNIATLFFWNKSRVVSIDGNGQFNSKEPVATIQGEKITYNNWINAMQNDYGKKQLEQMIDREVVKQLAEKQDIKIDKKVVDREISLLMTMEGIMTKKETEKKEKEWRKDILYRYKLGELLAKDTAVSDEEVREYYDEYRKQYDFQGSMQLSHIVIPDLETGKKVKEELDNGASFNLLAMEYSSDDETKNDGGYLGFFVNTSELLPPEYYEAAKDMDERTYSKPLTTDRGVALMYVHRKLPSIEFTYDEIKPYIKTELALEKLDQSLTAKPLWNKLDMEWIYE